MSGCELWRSSSTARPLAVLLVLLCLGIGGDSTAIAQVTPTEPAAPQNPVQSDVVHSDAAEADHADRDRKERVASIGILLIAGITSAGILLISVVLIWGSRVRRISRQRDPAAPPVDPLWYLRGSPPPEQSGNEGGPAGGTTGHGDESEEPNDDAQRE